MNRELIMTTLFQRLTQPPLMLSFTADVRQGDQVLYSASDAASLMPGMPLFGPGIAAGATVTATQPTVTMSLPGTGDYAGASLQQGILTASRRLVPAAKISDTPALFLAGGVDTYPPRPSMQPARITLRPAIYLYYFCPDPDAVPETVTNALLDAIDQVIDPDPRSDDGVWQTLRLAGVVHARIEGDVVLNLGTLDGRVLCTVPLAIEVVQSQSTRAL